MIKLFLGSLIINHLKRFQRCKVLSMKIVVTLAKRVETKEMRQSAVFILVYTVNVHHHIHGFSVLKGLCSNS